MALPSLLTHGMTSEPQQPLTTLPKCRGSSSGRTLVPVCCVLWAFSSSAAPGTTLLTLPLGCELCGPTVRQHPEVCPPPGTNGNPYWAQDFPLFPESAMFCGILKGMMWKRNSVNKRAAKLELKNILNNGSSTKNKNETPLWSSNSAFEYIPPNGFLSGTVVKNLPAHAEGVGSLSQEDLLD